jgi:hypothetical protein
MLTVVNLQRLDLTIEGLDERGWSTLAMPPHGVDFVAVKKKTAPPERARPFEGLRRLLLTPARNEAEAEERAAEQAQRGRFGNSRSRNVVIVNDCNRASSLTDCPGGSGRAEVDKKGRTVTRANQRIASTGNVGTGGRVGGDRGKRESARAVGHYGATIDRIALVVENLRDR